jgi:isoleucyl-tRNA synthetase
MAPMLSFTAEEAWAVLNPPREGEPQESIFLHTWTDVLPRQEDEKELAARWKRIREVRAEVVKRLEHSRAAGLIGSSLQANVSLLLPQPDLDLLRALGDDLKFVFITSSADVAASSDDGIMIEVRASHDTKCERCWHYRPDVGSDRSHATLCGRCVKNLEGPGEDRRHA